MNKKFNLFNLIFIFAISLYLFSVIVITSDHLSNRGSLTVHLDSVLISFSNLDNAYFELYQYGSFQILLYLPLIFLNYLTSDFVLSFTFLCWVLASISIFLLFEITKKINQLYATTAVLFYVYCVYYYQLAFGNYDLYFQSSIFIFFPIILSCYFINIATRLIQNNKIYKFFFLSNILLAFCLFWNIPVYIMVLCSYLFILIYIQIKKLFKIRSFILCFFIFCQFLLILLYLYIFPEKNGWLSMMKVYLSSNTSYRILSDSLTEAFFLSFFIILILNLAKNFITDKIQDDRLISFLFFSMINFFLFYRFIIQSSSYMFFYYFAWPLLFSINLGPNQKILNLNLKYFLNLIIIFTILINVFFGINKVFKNKYSIKDSTFDYYSYYKLLDNLEGKNFYLVNFQSLFYFNSDRELNDFFLNKNQFVHDEHIERFINILRENNYDNIIISENYYFNNNYQGVLNKIFDNYKSKPQKKKLLRYNYYELSI